MVKRKTAIKIRKAHRYLGIFLGVQFLFWTVSGLYFSWTDIDEIHGDHFIKEQIAPVSFTGLIGTESLKLESPVESMELIHIAGAPYYWINGSQLYNALTGVIKEEVTEEEALKVAGHFMKANLVVSGIRRLDSVGLHSEYRGRPLPAYEISYDSPENIKAYVAVKNGTFQTIRHRNWRWFDFLWMTHTMDYEGRDNINTLALRIFSFLGLITVLSGFLLWFTSSPTLRKLKKGLLIKRN